MQAIRTHFLPATNYKGSRIKAACHAKSITLSWDHALNPSGNHTWAAKELATQMGWNYGVWVSGELPDGSTVFCCHDTKGISDTFTVEIEKAA